MHNMCHFLLFTHIYTYTVYNKIGYDATASVRLTLKSDRLRIHYSTVAFSISGSG